MKSNYLIRLLIFAYSFFLCIPTLTKASTQDPSNRIEQGEGVIYVADGTVVHGLSNISYTRIEKIASPKPARPKTNSKPAKNIIAKQEVRESTASKETLKKIKENQKLVLPLNFTSTPNRDHIVNSRYSTVVALAPTNSNYTFKLYGNLPADFLVITKFAAQTTQQKFSSSQSCLQFSKLVNSFLRGPPVS